MGDVDHRAVELSVELRNLRAGLDPHLGVEVGKGFIKEEGFRLTNDGPTQSYPLALSSRKGFGFSFEQIIGFEKTEDFGGGIDSTTDFILGNPTQLEAESHVPVYGHVGVESVVLEDHGDIAVFGGYFVYLLTIQID
jgi:hypothetical protein